MLRDFFCSPFHLNFYVLSKSVLMNKCCLCFACFVWNKNYFWTLIFACKSFPQLWWNMFFCCKEFMFDVVWAFKKHVRLVWLLEGFTCQFRHWRFKSFEWNFFIKPETINEKTLTLLLTARQLASWWFGRECFTTPSAPYLKRHSMILYLL